MEENRENREQEHHNGDGHCGCKHPMMRHIFIALLTFLGAFMAFYVVADWHYKQMFDPIAQMNRMDRMIRSDFDSMSKIAEKQIMKGARFAEKNESYIRLERADKSYKVIVDLRPFDNDEKNIEVSADGNVLTITAAGSSNKHGHERILKISQNYMFDEDVNLENMTKIRQGDDLVIYIPTEK